MIQFTENTLLYRWEEQKALIDITDDYSPPNKEDYMIVITKLYTSLADVDNSGETTKLLDVMFNSLKEMGLQNEIIYQEIGYWLEARQSASENNFDNALNKFTEAIDLDPQNRNPAILFERARVYTQLEDYENALKDYEQVIAIVPDSNIEPTEGIILSTPSLTPSPSKTSTPTQTLTPTPTEISLGVGYINKATASILEEPNGRLIEKLELNHPLTLLEKKEVSNSNWYRCRWNNNGIIYEGWVFADNITFGPAPTPQGTLVTTISTSRKGKTRMMLNDLSRAPQMFNGTTEQECQAAQG